MFAIVTITQIAQSRLWKESSKNITDVIIYTVNSNDEKWTRSFYNVL